MSTHVPSPQGTYRLTSCNILMSPRAHGRYTISVKCQRYKDQSTWVPSSLDYDIANNDGKLEWAPHGVKNPVTPPEEATHAMPEGNAPAGTYLLSSKNVEFVETTQGRHQLRAECRRLDGSYVASTLDFDIVNCDGKLMWDPHGKLVEAMKREQG